MTVGCRFSISKLLERVVQSRLQAFLDNNDMMHCQQHSPHIVPCTAQKRHFLKRTMTCCSLLMVDRSRALCLLDLTAAFDTVDHDLLILLMLRLERQFGLRGVVLSWFRSYLSGRTFRVLYIWCIMHTCGATFHGVHCVLGPPRFCLRSAAIYFIYRWLARRYREARCDVTRVCRRHTAYLHCRLDDMASSAVRLERCISWKSATGCLPIGSSWMLTKLSCSGLQDLGVVVPKIIEKTWLSFVGWLCGPALQFGMDTVYSFQQWCSSARSDIVVRSDHGQAGLYLGFYRLRQLRRVRRSLDSESAATLVHAFVTCRIDYCKVLVLLGVLAGAPKATRLTSYSICWMRQHVLLVTRASLIVVWRSLCVLTSLTSLDVPERVKFKLVSMVHNCLCDHKAPRVLDGLVTAAFPSLMWPVHGIFVLL